MLIAVVAYFFSFFFVRIFKKKKRVKKTKFPVLRMNKSGIFFNSNAEHLIKIDNVKLMQVGTVLYVKTSTDFIIFSNVKDAKVIDGCLIFRALGKVKILFDCSKYYRYFLLNIKSQQFDLGKLKQLAILDLMNNNFDINFCKFTKKYIKIIKNVLNIHIFKEKIVIKKNKFKLSFIASYKLNNVIKHVSVNETI